MARIPTLAALTPALLLLGCDALPSPTDLAAPTAERPEGWESLEGEEAAVRLYYQFVDARGRVRFVERIEEVPEALRANVGFVKLDVPPPLSPAQAAQARQQRRERGGVALASTATGATPVLYSAEWCGACRKAKRYLARKGVAYDERNVDDPAIAQELVGKTGSRAIPVMDVGGRIVTGFSPGSYDTLLDAS